MKEDKKLEISLETAICIFIIFILVIALGITYYLGFIKNNTTMETATGENQNYNTQMEEDSEDIANNIISKAEESDKNTVTTNSQNNQNKIDLMQFDTEFYNLEDVALEYRLSKNISNYKDFTYDLDGDGIEDKITIKKDKGNNYIFQLNNKTFEENEYSPEIYIVDLNESDKTIEVVIYDIGASDNPVYNVYSKQGSKMQKHDTEINGTDLKLDNNGTLIVEDEISSVISPKIYSMYYTFNNGELSEKTLDTETLENTDFTIEEGIYFTTDLDNLEVYFEEEAKGKSQNECLKKANIQELDKNTTFKILEINEDEEMYVELSNGKKGYIFPADGYLVG